MSRGPARCRGSTSLLLLFLPRFFYLFLFLLPLLRLCLFFLFLLLIFFLLVFLGVSFPKRLRFPLSSHDKPE